MIKQIQFRGVGEEGEIFCQPLIEDGLSKTASPSGSGNLHPQIADFVKNVRPTREGIYVLVSALGAGEYWGSNVNGDLFPEKALIHAPDGWDKMSRQEQTKKGAAWEYGFPTFMGAHPFKHHQNKNPSRAFGRVELSTWNPKMHRVELIIYLDRELCKKFDAYDVIERIERGEFPDVSMGTRVPYDICTICGHKSKTRRDYCIHAATMMNKILPDGRKVAVRNDFPKFFDISFVFIGADKTAKTMAKIASKGNQVCLGEYCTIPRLSADVGEQFSKEAAPETGVVPRRFSTRQLVRTGRANAVKAISLLANNEQLSDSIDNALTARDVYSKARSTHHQHQEKRANDPVKAKIEVQGIPVHIEWPKGDTRQFKDKKTGKIVRSQKMQAHYGYIPGTRDHDGEELDAYVGSDHQHPTAYVIKQLKDDGSFDEHKVMLGYPGATAAKAGYLAHQPKKRFGSIEAVPVAELRKSITQEPIEKAAHACKCGGVCDPCGGSLEKVASAIFQLPAEKSASHRKVGEIIKSIPAGPFSKDTLPKVEKTERDLPKDVLDIMGQLPLGSALSTPAMMGIVLKPKEFQRVVLVRMGEQPLADELDAGGETFMPSMDMDESIPIDSGLVDDRLKELLSLVGALRDRSVAQPALSRRITIISLSAPQSPKTENVRNDTLMKKLGAAYNGYRRAILKKASQIQQYLVTDPLLRSDLFGASMAQAFAGGIDKTSSSVFGPDSLAYLVGAHYRDRDFHLSSKEVVASLAQTGAVVEAA